MSYKSKILSLEVLINLRKTWKQNSETLVFTNGCFDILHRGHVDYLNKAATLGTKLIVAVNSDSSVTALKNPSRPIQDEDSRAEIIAALGFVDAVILFSDSTPKHLIELINPDILVKGSDYKIEEIVGYEFIIANGGQVTTIDFLPGYSTSLIEKKIKGI